MGEEESSERVVEEWKTSSLWAVKWDRTGDTKEVVFALWEKVNYTTHPSGQ